MDRRQLSPGSDLPVPYEPQSVEFPSVPLTSGNYPSPAQAGTTLWEYLRTLYKHRWLILASVVIVTTLATIATLKMTPIYEASGRIEINRPAQDILPFKDAHGMSSGDDDSLEIETQVKILQSDSLAADAAKRLSGSSAGFLGIKGTPVPAAGEAPRLDTAQTARSAGAIKGGLSITTVPRTRLVDIRYASPNPQAAAEVVNTLIDSYIEHNIRSHFESTMQASEWLSRQLTDLKIKAETSQQRLVEYQQQKQIVGVDEKQNITLSKLDALNSELTRAEAERIQKEANYRISNAEDPEQISTLAKNAETNSTLNALKGEEAKLKTQIAQLQVLYGPSHPKMAEVRNQLASVQSSIQGEVKRNAAKLKSDYESALQRETMLRRAFESQKVEANKLNLNAIEFMMLKRDADASRQLYDGLLQKLKEAQVSAGLKSSNVRVVDAASVPSGPSRPNKRLNIMLGLLLGLAGGIGVAFLIESLDTTVSSPEDAEMATGLPSLGVIPLIARAPMRKLLARTSEATATPGNSESQMIAHFRPRSQSAEAYRALRTSLLLSGSGTPPKTIVITSPLPQEGKTSTTINSAVVLTQMGARVLLIDCDLRRPGVHRALDIPNRTGLSTLLATGKGLESVVMKSLQIPNLYVVPAGPPPPQPAELLSSKFFQDCLAKWKQEFDHILIDTPPVLSVTDAVVLSVYADSVVLVVRSDVTTKNALRQARDLLLQVNARVTGTLLNGVDLTSPGSYYYYYSYGYGQKNRYYNESRRS